jgi:endonuclease/exonuclease/phosphatase family metal-dependent hydrolase
MAVSKLTPYANYTYATKKLAYRSILDRVITTIGKQHCNPTTVLDWGEKNSDHRPVQISIDLNSL